MYAVYLALSWHIINAQESGSHPLLLTSLLRSVPAVTKEQILHPPLPRLSYPLQSPSSLEYTYWINLWPTCSFRTRLTCKVTFSSYYLEGPFFDYTLIINCIG